MAEDPAHTVSNAALREWGSSLLWLVLFLSPLLFSARTTEAFEYPKLAFQRGMAIVLLAGGACAIGAGRTGLKRVGAGLRGACADPIALGVLLSLFAGVVSTATSMSPRTSFLGVQASFTGLVTMLAQTVLFFAARALCRDASSSRIVLTGAAGGMALSAGYGLAQLAGLDPLRWQAPVVFSGVSRVFSTQGHPNSFAQLLAVSLPVTLYLLVRALQERRLAEAVFLGAAAAAANGLALLTLSRAGMLAIAAAWVALAAGGALTSTGRSRWLALLGIAGLLAMGVALASVPDESSRGVSVLWQRLAGLGDGSTVAEDPRRFLWTAAGAMFREHPVAGVGLDCFSLAFGRHRTAAAWAAEWGETPLKAHSQPLEILATQGLLGAAAALVFCYGVASALLGAWRRQAADRWLALTAFSGLLAFGVHCLFHFPTAAVTALGLALAAILSRLADRRPEPAPDAPIPAVRVLAIGGLAGVALFFGVIQPFRADVLGRRAAALTQREPRLAVEAARAAVRLDPSRDLLWLRRAAAVQASARAEVDPVVRRAGFAEARQSAEEAIRREPSSVYSRANLGLLLADLARESPPLATRAEVEQAFLRARELDPNNSYVHMAAATAALAAGDWDRTVWWARLCSRLYPRYATPYALLGAASLGAGRELAASGHPEPARMAMQEAVQYLREALAAEWHGDQAALAAALANRSAAMRALAELD